MSKTSKSNPKELLDRYLYAVRFWLPKSQQADITAELSEDLRSQVEDKEAELGHPLGEEEIMAILKRCGSPIKVASRYRPQTQLIGPVLFPIYGFVLKLVLLWVLLPVFILIIGPALILPAADHVGAFVRTLGTLWTALFMSAAIITLVFAVLERTGAALHLEDDWGKCSLPPLPKQTQAPSTTHTIFELVFALAGILYLVALPHYPFLLLGPAAAFLKLSPLWNTFYWPIIALASLNLAREFVNLLRPQWLWFQPAAQLFNTAAWLIVLNFMIEAASRIPSGDWHPFVMLADTMQPTLQLMRTAAIVNVSILLTLVCVWFGFCIAAVVQTWQLVRTIRKRDRNACSVALLGLL
jgi:hypothetical protein